MNGDILDDFEDLSGWTAIASGQARLALSPERGRHGGAMRLDFDFRGGGGFVVARKLFDLSLPENYAFGFGIRGIGPSNIFEFKLVDASNQNVWRWRKDVFELPADWLDLRIKSSQIAFAWGPVGGGTARDIAAIEFVVAAGPGGQGSLWIEELRLTDTSYYLTPLVEATTALPGCEPRHVCDPSPATGWRSAPTDQPQRLLIDFQAEREYGGLAIRWEPERRPRSLAIRLSCDGHAWQTCLATDQGVGEETYVYLPDATSRYVALDLVPDTGREGVGIQCVEIQPYDFSRSLNDFLAAIAKRARPGLYPKYFLGHQTYWTPVGTGEDVTQALFNEEGMVEVDKGSFSIEPFLFADGRLISWADAGITQRLERGDLPLPSSDWRAGDLRLCTTAFATGACGASSLFIRYRIANDADMARPVSLFAAIRPFQVTPTWQHWQHFGGVSPITELAYEHGAVRVNRGKRIIPLNTPSGFGAATFDQGPITDALRSGELPARDRVNDPFGYASGALRFDLDLPARSEHEVFLAIPFGDWTPERAADWPTDQDGVEQFARAVSDWQAKLDVLDIQLSPRAAGVVETLKTAAAHILINRDGPALQPGPRRYSRAWIRDGALMGAALARVDYPRAGRDFIRWYAGFQTPDGNLPDCADRDGQEWLPEFDSWGELIFAVMDHYRFSGDQDVLAEMWPAVLKSVDYLERLRDRRLTPEYRTEAKRAYYGLLPESMSHEGYMAHPVHAYWDDFWAVRGFKDAAEMAAILGEPNQAQRIAALRDAFRETLYASLDRVIAERGIDFVPGSVEFADFDPSATAIAIAIADELHKLPRPAIEQTFEKYLIGFRERTRPDANWANYTAYEIRIIAALVRLGWRHEAHKLLDFFLADRRIRPWNQWPEISWRDPLGPSFIGDMPHSWIGAEYILAVRSLFAYEREADHSLVIAAGVPGDWLEDDGEVRVRDLPTHHGKLSFGLRRETPHTLRLTLAGDLVVPSGGILVMPPLARPLVEVRIDGRPGAAFGPDWVRCDTCPADLWLRC